MDIRPNLMPPGGFRGGGPFRGACGARRGGGPSTLAWVIFALVLVLLLLAIASLAIDAYYRSRASRPAAGRMPGPAPGPAAIEALAVLDARYARGEIPRDEYLQARDDLRGTPEAPTAGDSSESGARSRVAPSEQASPAPGKPGQVTLRAVLFDVDFTLARPGPDLGPEGYRRLGERYGLDLDPARYEEARTAAIATLERHPELRHDEELWFAFTERIVRGMGGEADAARDLAVEMTRAWERSENFDLYDDVLPVLARLREHGLKLGLVSNGGREISDFVAHHRLEVDCAVASRAHGWTKPHESIFLAALDLIDVAPADAAMVGDSVEDDIEGAVALGMRAILVDREGRQSADAGGLPDLWGLPAALGL